MLRRPVQSQRPGEQVAQTATAGGFGIISRPFKAPTPLAPKRHTELPSRKRKAVSYKDAGGDVSGSDAENEEPDSKRNKGGKGYAMGNKEYDDNGVLGGMGKLCMKKYPVFALKSRGSFLPKR